jgi:hypothetical protein
VQHTMAWLHQVLQHQHQHCTMQQLGSGRCGVAPAQAPQLLNHVPLWPLLLSKSLASVVSKAAGCMLCSGRSNHKHVVTLQQAQLGLQSNAVQLQLQNLHVH